MARDTDRFHPSVISKNEFVEDDEPSDDYGLDNSEIDGFSFFKVKPQSEKTQKEIRRAAIGKMLVSGQTVQEIERATKADREEIVEVYRLIRRYKKDIPTLRYEAIRRTRKVPIVSKNVERLKKTNRVRIVGKLLSEGVSKENIRKSLFVSMETINDIETFLTTGNASNNILDNPNREPKRSKRKDSISLWGPNSMEQLFKRGMYAQGDKLEKAAKLLEEGKSVRKIVELTGMSKGTVSKLRSILKETLGIEPVCGCGLPATHQGFCSFRVTNSPNRQEFLKKWHLKQKKEEK